MSRGYENRHEMDKATRSFEKLVGSFPNSDKAKAEFASFLVRRKSLVAAEKQAKAGHAINPSNVPTQIILSHLKALKAAGSDEKFQDEFKDLSDDLSEWGYIYIDYLNKKIGSKP